MLENVTPIIWKDKTLFLLDQRLLPTQEDYIKCNSVESVANAISTMVVRGAPAIGVTAAFGLALGTLHSNASTQEEFSLELEKFSEQLFQTRPTAVNLGWALKRIQKLVKESFKIHTLDQTKEIIVHEAQKILQEDIQINQKIGENGQVLLKNNDTVLTHCNAGALATAGFGTALGVIYAAKNHQKNISVYADETRPVLQGARLTSWELCKNDIPTTVIADNMAASLMQKNLIHKVIVGADRIAANGDVANKIGTYSVAILAKYHNIPFYVAAPLSTIDMNCPSGQEIPIEERNHNEVSHINNKQMTHTAAKIVNPAFDVTPNDLVSGIITEKGVLTAPYTQKIAELFK